MKTVLDLREAWETQKGVETKRKANTDIEEATGKFTDKQIKMAYGIINDPRWKSGNMTSIVRRIEGIAKGLSKHAGVQKALKVTNEEVQIDEANLSKVSTDKLKKMIRQAEDERVSPAFAMQVRAARAELKKRGESMKESVELDEAAPKISTGKAKGAISATGLRGKGMKKFDVDVSVKNGKFEFRISDESGKFQTVGIKQAARMLGESVEDLEAFAIEEARKYTPPSAAEIAADKKKDQRGKPRASMSAKSANKKVYGNMMKKHEETELDERSPLQSIKVALGKKFNKNYEKALEWMKKTGKSAADAERMFRGVDARELAKMAEQ